MLNYSLTKAKINNHYELRVIIFFIFAITLQFSNNRVVDDTLHFGTDNGYNYNCLQDIRLNANPVRKAKHS